MEQNKLLRIKQKVINELFNMADISISKFNVDVKQIILRDDDWHKLIILSVYDGEEYYGNIEPVIEVRFSFYPIGEARNMEVYYNKNRHKKSVYSEPVMQYYFKVD